MKILFAEDDDDQRETGVFLLSISKEHEVQSAANGRDALQKIESFPADVLTTDNQMPFMNGTDLIRKVKRSYPGVHTVLTGGHSNIPELAQACGADVFFQKPFHWEEILSIIKTWER